MADNSEFIIPNGVEYCTAEPDQIRSELEELGEVDLVVGVPSYNEADSIAHVVRQCDGGLRQHFPEFRGLIVNADNNSQDGTQDAFLSTETESPKFYISTPNGVKGKGKNFLNLFQIANQLKAKGIVVVDADLESITPEWIQDLASPVLLQGVDYVTPIYARNEYDGAITNHLCYPLIYGLFGREVRQPIGGDFCLSGRFVAHTLGADWKDTTREYGVDIFLTMSAITGGFRIAQTRLGTKIHKPIAPELGPMITQVLSTLFVKLSDNKDKWSMSNGVAATERMYGDRRLDPPQPLPVDYKSIKEAALDGYEEQRLALADYLAPTTFEKIDEIMASGRMRLTSLTWVRTVFDLLYAFDKQGQDPRVIEALKPLFFARIASFIRYTLDLNHEESEMEIRLQAREFRRARPYIKRRYREEMPG